MGEMEIIINEKNKEISSLKKTISERKDYYESKISKLKSTYDGCVDKKSVAQDVIDRLKTFRVLAWITIIAPVPICMVSSINILAGGVLAIASAAGGVIIYKRNIASEIDYLTKKYDIKG